MIDGRGISCDVLRNMSSDLLTHDKSTLVQVMAWCRQATSHYLSQCWPWSMPPYGVTRPQWVNAFVILVFIVLDNSLAPNLRQATGCPYADMWPIELSGKKTFIFFSKLKSKCFFISVEICLKLLSASRHNGYSGFTHLTYWVLTKHSRAPSRHHFLIIISWE